MAKKKATKMAKKAPKKAAKPPAPKLASPADAIHQLDAEFMKAASAKSAASLVKAFYAPDAVLMPPNHPIVEGRAKIQGFLQALIDSGLTSIKVDTTTIAGAGDLAYGRGRYSLTISPPSGAPVGYLHRDAGGGRVPLLSAIHPITGDQLLTTNRWEATDLGYGEPTLLGHLEPSAPVTGRLGTGRPRLPWASRFGQRVRD